MIIISTNYFWDQDFNPSFTPVGHITLLVQAYKEEVVVNHRYSSLLSIILEGEGEREPVFLCCHQHSNTFICVLFMVPVVDKSTGCGARICVFVSQLSHFLACVSLSKWRNLSVGPSFLTYKWGWYWYPLIGSLIYRMLNSVPKKKVFSTLKKQWQ